MKLRNAFSVSRVRLFKTNDVASERDVKFSKSIVRKTLPLSFLEIFFYFFSENSITTIDFPSTVILIIPSTYYFVKLTILCTTGPRSKVLSVLFLVLPVIIPDFAILAPFSFKVKNT